MSPLASMKVTLEIMKKMKEGFDLEADIQAREKEATSSLEATADALASSLEQRSNGVDRSLKSLNKDMESFDWTTAVEFQLKNLENTLQSHQQIHRSLKKQVEVAQDEFRVQTVRRQKLREHTAHLQRQAKEASSTFPHESLLYEAGARIQYAILESNKRS